MTNSSYLQLLQIEQENLTANLKTLFDLGETKALVDAIPYYRALTDFTTRLAEAIVTGAVTGNAEAARVFTFIP